MKVFDIKNMKAFSHAERNKNVLYGKENFKVRIIELPSQGEIQSCEMMSNVIFYVVKGTAEIMVNGEKTIISEGQCLITEPATISMRTENYLRMIGIQIN